VVAWWEERGSWRGRWRVLEVVGGVEGLWVLGRGLVFIGVFGRYAGLA